MNITKCVIYLPKHEKSRGFPCPCWRNVSQHSCHILIKYNFFLQLYVFFIAHHSYTKKSTFIIVYLLAEKNWGDVGTKCCAKLWKIIYIIRWLLLQFESGSAGQTELFLKTLSCTESSKHQKVSVLFLFSTTFVCLVICLA